MQDRILEEILVVEDNSETQLIVKVILREFYDVEVVDNALGAIELIKNNNFDLIVLDINLAGEQDGKFVIQKVRSELNLPDLPVIIITAYDLPGNERSILENLSNDYIEKPIEKTRLLTSISNCLR